MLLLTLLAGFSDWLSGFASSLSSWVLAIAGIGLVVFVHELGHFLVAKKFGVRVEIFSLGFGPRLLGLKRGDTDYRVSLVPIGGYVKMAGDNPGDPLQGDGGELPSKSVGQRFAIFAAGVAMNLVFAIVVLPIVLAVGVQFTSTRIGSVQPGGPAWFAGISKGDEVVTVRGHRVTDFNDVVAEVALAGSDVVDVDLNRPADGPEPATPVSVKLSVRPVYDEALGRYVIGIGPSPAPTFQVERSGPAASAGMTSHDRIVRFNGRPLASVDEFETARVENRAERVLLGIVGADGVEREVAVEPELTKEPVCLIGIKPYQDVVKGLRNRAARDGFLKTGDEILGLEQKLESEQSVEPPIRFTPIGDAAGFANACEQAAQLGPNATLRILRAGEVLHLGFPADVDRAFADDVALVTSPNGRRVRLMNGYPAALAGLPEGAEITRVNNIAVSTWAEIKERIEKAAPENGSEPPRPVEIVAEADGVEHVVTVTPRVEKLPIDFGLIPMLETVERSYPFPEAVRVGVSSAGYMIKNVYLTLKKILVRDVSASNLSGILTIAYVSRSLAESGLATLFFFLAVLSLNLAFLNLLPIPVLDGGHLFFLIVEKVKGSPVSERVLGFSQIVGLVLVLALLLFVTYNDLRRLFL
jgi:regulator of sigma E protease